MLRDRGRIHDLSGVAYGINQFVATGWNPFDVATTILTSLDGTNWVRRESAAQDAGSAIAYANGQFVAVGSQIQTSTDGMRWVQGQLLAPSFLLGIVYGNGQFVAVGSFGIILTSTNAVNWVQRQSGIKTGLRGIGYGNGHFVSVGDIGTILQSGNIINLSITRSTGPLTLSLEGPSGLEYTIQTSNDLVAWREVTKITNAQSAKVILDGLSATAERAFYRAYVP